MRLQVSEEKYARALRAIGQDLAGLFPERLEIERCGQEFVARGCGRANPLPSEGILEKSSVLRNIWHQLTRPSPKTDVFPPPPRCAEFVRTYTSRDIRRLDETGATHRRALSERPDLYSLEERLRMIGKILDEKKGELVKLSQDSNTVTFQYLDEDGHLHSESCSTLELYKLQQEYYSGRRGSLTDPWQGIRS